MHRVNGKGERVRLGATPPGPGLDRLFERQAKARDGPEQQQRVSGMNKFLIGLLGVAALGWTASAASATTLDDVKAKGFLQCGVNTGLAGFSAPNDKGDWTGLDV